MLRLSFAIAALFLAGCVTPDSARLKRFEFEEPQMGVPFRMVLYAVDEAAANRAAEAAFRRIAELNAIMSDYETDSELSRLSRSSEEGSPRISVSADLWRVLSVAQGLAADSDGAFDVTIGPCAALWRKARREGELPEPRRVETALRKVGYQNLQLEERTRSARLTRFGMRLDLGGIAKGYAADEALKVLRGHGVYSALVAASGDLALGDAPPGERGWRVEITGPDAGSTRVLRLKNRGVATSGDLFQRLEMGGVRYSHIVNPFTCVGMTNHALANVIASDCMTADMLATTLTILPPNEGLKLAGRHRAAMRVTTLENETPVLVENRRFRELRE